MAHVKGGESVVLKERFRMLQRTFPEDFNFLNPADVLFFAVDDEHPQGYRMRIIFNCEIPWKYILSQKYVIIAYPAFLHLSNDQQMLELSHYLFRIPEDYIEKGGLVLPDIVKFSKEEKIEKWMQERSFARP